MPVISRRDVAARAGTSVAVVSYVVNNGPRPVSSATRARVEAAIAELGYRPNGLARALRSQRTEVVGMVMPDMSNPFNAELARWIEEAAFEAGYVLLLGNSLRSGDREGTYVGAFLDRRVDGILLISGGDGAETRRALDGSAMPVVMVDRRPAGLRGLLVDVDNVEGGRMAAEHLIGHGHKHFVCLHGPREVSHAWHRKRGFAEVVDRSGRSMTLDLAESDFTRESAYEVGRDLLRRRQLPEAIFACSDEQAIGILRAAADTGVRIPGDVALLGFDGIPEGRFTVPRLATVVQPYQEIAHRAVQSLVAVINGASDGMDVRLGLDLLAGGSCGCPDAPVP